jgi:hypothetical protein
MVRKVLLICGIVAPLLYIGTDILAAMSWENYSYTAQGISELGAIGAPTRPFISPIFVIHSLLKIAFAVGVWMSAGSKRSLRITAALLFALGVLDIVSYLFPAGLRENLGDTGFSLTDNMHLILTGAAVILILLIIGFGATAGGKWFRLYSYATIVALVVSGVWAFSDAPNIAAGLPTPWLGVRERINVYGYLLWIAILAVVLWRAPETANIGKPSAGIGSPQLTHVDP